MGVPESAAKFRDQLLHWAEQNLRQFPWREPGRSLYEVFIAEFFLTQTPAQNVDRLYKEFLEEYPSLQSLGQAEVTELESRIKPIGFHRMRAKALKSIADSVDELPREPEDLQELERVGPYVANASLCFAECKRLPVRDRNVDRVYTRVFEDEYPDSPSNRRQFCLQMLPGDPCEARTYNLALLDFGALVCDKQDPACADCFASPYCKYPSKRS